MAAARKATIRGAMDVLCVTNDPTFWATHGGCQARLGGQRAHRGYCEKHGRWVGCETHQLVVGGIVDNIQHTSLPGHSLHRNKEALLSRPHDNLDFEAAPYPIPGPSLMFMTISCWSATDFVLTWAPSMLNSHSPLSPRKSCQHPVAGRGT